ncbi:MAG: hypothetical protein QFB87_03565 [Patescibacteria group bacterium]|nr:hypothetical protein [Patescibacteria group bacterium]
MITEIQAPELMDVASVRTLTYARYQALHVSANKAEYGYSQFTASQTSELPTATKPPQTGFMRRLKLVK